MRADLAALPPYRPGRSATGGTLAHKLSSNELPFGPLPSVEEAIAALLGSINRYPDLSGAELVAPLVSEGSARSYRQRSLVSCCQVPTGKAGPR